MQYFLNLLILFNFRFGDHKRDRFDSYNRVSGGYHRDRDRERERGHVNDKRSG